MSASFRHLFKDIAIYSVGDLLLRATAFITLPIYTRIFSPADYGIWSFVLTVVGFLSAILALGGESAYSRFFFAAKTLDDKQTVTSTWFGFLALWSSAIVLLCLPFTGPFTTWALATHQSGILLAFALLAAPITQMNSLCGQVLRNQFRAQLFTALNFVSTLLTVGASLFAAVVLDLGLIGVMVGPLLAAGILLPIRLWTARAMFRRTFSFRVLRDLLAFGVPLVPMSLAYWVFGTSDRLVLGKLSTLEQLGLYAVANAAASPLVYIHSALGQAWSPHALQVYEKHPEAAPEFFGRVMTYILVGFGLLTVGITTFSQEALMVLSTPSFYPAALAIAPLALGFMASASTQVTALSISFAKQTKYFALFSGVAALLNLVLNVLLVPKWGMMASSWATTISYAFLTVAYLFTSQRLWPVVYEKRRALTAVALTLAFTIAARFLPNPGLVAALALKSVYCITYSALLLVLGVLDRREWYGALQALRELRTGWMRGLA